MFRRNKSIGYMNLNLVKSAEVMKSRVVSKAEELMVKQTVTAEFEDALDLSGVGKFQVFHVTLMWFTLASAILEIIGNAFILPAAACDLELPEHLKGIIISIPNIGVILTAPLWGRAADALGRRPVLLWSSAAAGSVGVLAAFMPGLASYALCKFFGSLFLAAPSSLGFAYAGEMVPRRRRDLAILICNGLLMCSSTFSPVFAWAILPSAWRYELPHLILRPWRLLTAVYAAPLIIAALWMTQAKESPKFLMTQGKNDEALMVLRHIYAKNTGYPPENYCVTSLKTSEESTSINSIKDDTEEGSEAALARKPENESALALLRPPHAHWLALTGFLMFGLFSLLNGLFLFATDTVNKAMKGSVEEEGTVCILLNQAKNTTLPAMCEDDITSDTLTIMLVSGLLSSVVVMGASLCPVTKKTLLVAMFLFNGVACFLSGTLTNRLVAGAAMSALQVTSLGIGPLTAYAVQLFPTSLRGTAVGAVLMCGRLGSVVGANAAGYFLAVACAATFHGFTALLFLCAGLSFLLPK